MVNWGIVCGPKDFGGLGIVNTRIMNDCLLAKWIWKIQSTRNELSFRIIKAKYFPRGVFREAKVHVEWFPVLEKYSEGQNFV